MVKLCLERRVLLTLLVGRDQFSQGGHEGFGDKLPPKWAKFALNVWDGWLDHQMPLEIATNEGYRIENYLDRTR